MYTINYGTGITEQVEGNLEEAKEAAVAGMSYTQQSVKIIDAAGEEVAVSHWYGVEPSEDDSVLARFGSSGFFSDWVDN